MSLTDTLGTDPNSHDPVPPTSHDGGAKAEVHDRGHVSRFWPHYLEMLAVMVVGMVVAGYILVRTVGLTSWNEATVSYPTQCLLVMAVGMSVPMVAWMRFRGHGWRSSSEMAAAMIVPVAPFLCLVWFGITKSAQCGGYCALSVVAMLALMLYRRDEYSQDHRNHSVPHDHASSAGR